MPNHTPRIKRRERFSPVDRTQRRTVEVKYPWEETKAVIKPQASSLDALSRAIARHETEYNPAADLGAEQFLDPAIFSDEEIKLVLGLPEKFNAGVFRSNPAILDEIPYAKERLQAYGHDLETAEAARAAKAEEDKPLWRDALSALHSISTGPALSALAWGMDEFYRPMRSFNQLIDEVEELDRRENESIDLLARQIEARPEAFPEGYLEQQKAEMVKGAPGLTRNQSTKQEIRYMIGKTLGFLAGAAPKTIMGDDADEDVARFMQRMQGPLASMEQSTNFPVFGDWAATAIRGGVSALAATTEPGGGFRFVTPERWSASMADAFTGIEGKEEGDATYAARIDTLTRLGATIHDAKNQAFNEREDIHKAIKIAVPVLTDPLTYAGIPPVWKAAKIPGMLAHGARRGLGYSNTAVGRVPGVKDRMFKGGLLSEEEALTRLSTNRSAVGQVVNRIPGTERLFGIASQIPRWKPGDIRRTISEGIGLHGIWSDQIPAIMSQTMQGFRALGDFTLIQPGKQMRRRWSRLGLQKEIRSGFEIVDDPKSPLHLTFAPGRVFKVRVPRPSAESIRETAFTLTQPFRSTTFKLVGAKNKFKLRFVGEEEGGDIFFRTPEGQREARRMVDEGEVDRLEDIEGYSGQQGEGGYIEKYELQSPNGKETWEIEVSTDPIDMGPAWGPNEAALNIYRTTPGESGFRMGISKRGLQANLAPDVMRDILALISRSDKLKELGITKLKGLRATEEYVEARRAAGQGDKYAVWDVEQAKRRVWQTETPGRFGTKKQFSKLEAQAEKALTKEAELAAAAKREPVYWRDVFERPGDFAGLTTKERALIADIQQWYKAMIKYARQEGVDIKELGSLEEAFSFVSAKVKGFKLGKTGKDGQKEYTSLAEARPKPGIETLRRTDFRKSRVYETMMDSVQKSGTDYYNPFETIESYGQAVLHEVMLKRLQKKYAPHMRGTGTKEVYPELYKAKQYAGKTVKRQRELVALVNQLKRNLLPHNSQINALKRWFPSLSSEIDEVMGFTKDRWMTAVRNMNASAKAGDFPAHVISALREMHFGTNLPKVIERKDVWRALKGAGLEEKQHRAMTTQVMRMIGDGYKADRKVLVDELMDKMKGLIPESEDVLSDLQKQMGHKAAIQRAPLFGERESKAFKGYIWTGDRAEWAWSKTERFMAPADAWYDRTVIPINSLIRSFKTVADFGSPLVHGLPLLMKDPEKWAFATTMHIRAFGDDAVKARYLADNAEDVSIFLKGGMHLGSTEMTEAARQGGTLARLPIISERITNAAPGLGADTMVARKARAGLNLVPRAFELGGRRFSSSFEAFLDIARIEVMKGLKETAMRSKNPERAMIEIAEFANKLTGVTSTRALGVPVGQRALESAALFFSPRYTRAIASLYLDMTRGGLKGELARSSIAHLFMGQIAIHAAMSHMLGQDMNLVPGPGFLKSRILSDEDSPGMNIGFGGKPNSLLNMLGDVTTQAIENPGGFLHVNVFSQETYDENSALKRMRYMESPLLQEFTNLITQSDPIGRKLPDIGDVKEILAYGATRLAPFAGEAAVEAGLNSLGATSFLVETAGGMTSPVSAYSQRDDLRDKYTVEDYGPDGKIEKLGLNTYEELKKYHRHKSLLAGMERRHADLVEWSNKASKQSEEYIRNDERAEIDQKKELIRTEAISGTYNEQGALTSKGYNQIGKELAESPHERAGRNFQQAFWGINKVENARNRQVELAHKQFFDDRHAYFENTEPANLSMGAVEDFMRFYLSPQARDEFGNLNHAAVDRKLEQIQHGIRLTLMEEGKSDEEATRISEEVTLENEEQYLQRFLQTPEGMELHPKVVRFIQGFPIIDDFHRVYQTALPEEQHTKWKVFIGASWAVKQQLLTQREYRHMNNKVTRAQERTRRDNYELDKHLRDYYDMAPVNAELKRETRTAQREIRQELRK